MARATIRTAVQLVFAIALPALQGCEGATPARCSVPVTVVVTVEDGVSAGVRAGVVSFVKNDPMLSASPSTVVVRTTSESLDSEAALSALDDAAEDADVHVVIARRFGTLRGRAFATGEISTIRRRPIFVISDAGVREVRKALHGMIRLRTIASWVSRHEAGHLRGLPHHGNPFCIMARPNASFGRLCRGCHSRLARCVLAH